MTCWSFGGIIEEREGCGTGWLFFDKMLTVCLIPLQMLIVGRVSCLIDEIIARRRLRPPFRHGRGQSHSPARPHAQSGEANG